MADHICKFPGWDNLLISNGNVQVINLDWPMSNTNLCAVQTQSFDRRCQKFHLLMTLKTFFSIYCLLGSIFNACFFLFSLGVNFDTERNANVLIGRQGAVNHAWRPPCGVIIINMRDLYAAMSHDNRIITMESVKRIARRKFHMFLGRQ